MTNSRAVDPSHLAGLRFGRTAASADAETRAGWCSEAQLGLTRLSLHCSVHGPGAVLAKVRGEMLIANDRRYPVKRCSEEVWVRCRVCGADLGLLVLDLDAIRQVLRRPHEVKQPVDLFVRRVITRADCFRLSPERDTGAAVFGDHVLVGRSQLALGQPQHV